MHDCVFRIGRHKEKPDFDWEVQDFDKKTLWVGGRVCDRLYTKKRAILKGQNRKGVEGKQPWNACQISEPRKRTRRTFPKSLVPIFATKAQVLQAWVNTWIYLGPIPMLPTLHSELSASHFLLKQHDTKIITANIILTNPNTFCSLESLALPDKLICLTHWLHWFTSSWTSKQW